MTTKEAQAKHTAGPWELKKHGDSFPYSNVYGVYHPCEGPVFTALCERSEAEANMRLIAAAPELLEAAKQALNDLQQRGTEHETIEMLSDAIRKAEGRE